MENLINKTAKEKASIKSDEIVKINFVGTKIRESVKIEIIKINKIEKGIEVLARAWKNKNQLGFGDGSVDIERFKIYNPPVLVDDPNGDIIRIFDSNKQRKLKFDPEEAILQTLEHTVGLVGKENTNIIKDKVGNTTSTFYPAAGSNSPVDGLVYHIGVDVAWTTLVGLGGTNASDSLNPTTFSQAVASTTTDQWQQLNRGIFLFDTSAIPDADIISSATLSLHGWAKNDALSVSPDLNVYSSAPAADNTLVAGDFDSLGSTAFSSALVYSSFSISAYNDFVFNASGIVAIDKAGISKFGAKNVNYDNADNAPSWTSGAAFTLSGYYADETGTSKDPKLVVVHNAVSARKSIIIY